MCIGKLIMSLRSRAMAITDKRVCMMGEILANMKFIKMYSWEKPLAKNVLGNTPPPPLFSFFILYWHSCFIVPVPRLLKYFLHLHFSGCELVVTVYLKVGRSIGLSEPMIILCMYWYIYWFKKNKKIKDIYIFIYNLFYSLFVFVIYFIYLFIYLIIYSFIYFQTSEQARNPCCWRLTWQPVWCFPSPS